MTGNLISAINRLRAKSTYHFKVVMIHSSNPWPGTFEEKWATNEGTLIRIFIVRV